MADLILTGAVRMPADKHLLSEVFMPGEEEALLKAASKDQIERLVAVGVLVEAEALAEPADEPVKFASTAAAKSAGELGLTKADMRRVSASSPNGFTKADVLDAAELKGVGI